MFNGILNFGSNAQLQAFITQVQANRCDPSCVRCIKVEDKMRRMKTYWPTVHALQRQRFTTLKQEIEQNYAGIWNEEHDML